MRSAFRTVARWVLLVATVAAAIFLLVPEAFRTVARWLLPRGLSRWVRLVARWVRLVARWVRLVPDAFRTVARWVLLVARWALLVAGLVTVVSGLLALAIWVVPGALVGAPREGLAEADRLKALNDARAPLVTVVGGLFLFTGALIGAVLTSRTIHVNREGQITDRFTKAISQLGDDKLDVRLGGIYALERIARESAADHGPIMEVLTAFLREHARVEPARAMPWQPVRAVGPLQPGTREDEPPRLRADVEAIATVLGRRPKERRRQEHISLDLPEVDLRLASLNEAHLEGVNLGGAHLEQAFLRGAHLEEAFLRGAHLEDAKLFGAHLERADLGGAHLEDAKLFGAHLERADLGGAHLEGANLFGAHLEGGNLRGAHLEGADFFDAHLEGADLIDAHLEGGNLRGAHLEGAYLIGAHLEGADLSGAHLEGADLSGADLREANLEGAYLYEAHLSGANFDDAHLKGADLRTARGLLQGQLRSATIDDATALPVFVHEAPRTTTPNPPS